MTINAEYTYCGKKGPAVTDLVEKGRGKSLMVISRGQDRVRFGIMPKHI